jgi:hypothetical protein
VTISHNAKAAKKPKVSLHTHVLLKLSNALCPGAHLPLFFCFLTLGDAAAEPEGASMSASAHVR